MERDCVVAHGMAEFTKERLMECSDSFSCYTCGSCGLLAVAHAEQNIWSCRGCSNTTNFAHIHVPYATKLLLQELETMNIGSRLITQQKLLRGPEEAQAHADQNARAEARAEQAIREMKA